MTFDDVIKAARTIKDYCREQRYCIVCPFYDTDHERAWCNFTEFPPLRWPLPKDEEAANDS